MLLITSKMPDKPFAVAKETVSVMPWNQYGTKDTYVTSQTSAAAGNRNGALSWLVTANYLDSYQQPLTYTTLATLGWSGKHHRNHWRRSTGRGRRQRRRHRRAGAFAADVREFRLAYDLFVAGAGDLFAGIWNNHQTSNPQTYLTSTLTGAPTFGGQRGFASNKYTWDQTHLSNAVSLKSDTKGVFDFDLSASTYNYLQDIMLNPFTVTPTGVGYSQNGKITRNDGTNWQNADAKGIWRPLWLGGAGDQLRCPWRPLSPGKSGLSVLGLVCDVFDRHRQLDSEGVGETRTDALWVQDAWKIVPNLKLTLGGRLENWRSLDGFNINSSGGQYRRPGVADTTSSRFRKASPNSVQQLFAQSVAFI